MRTIRRRSPRVVAWGGRERDVQVGSQYDRARSVWLGEIERMRRETRTMFARLEVGTR